MKSRGLQVFRKETEPDAWLMNATIPRRNGDTPDAGQSLTLCVLSPRLFFSSFSSPFPGRPWHVLSNALKFGQGSAQYPEG
jgi:hypothetical protein